MPRSTAVPVILFAFILVAVSSAHATWVKNGTAVSVLPDPQYEPVAVPDGSGGAILVWEDVRGGLNTDIYAQRIDRNGNPLWPANGVIVSVASDDQQNPSVVPDGFGGAIIVWDDYRDFGTTSIDIYAPRIDEDGNSLWTFNGVPVCNAFNEQEKAQIHANGVEFVMAWEDRRSGDRDIYVQRLDLNGGSMWTVDGVGLCVVAGVQHEPRITNDFGGGAIVTWTDYRSGSPDIYARAINFFGTPQWLVGGVGVAVVGGSTQAGPQLIPDQSGGAIIMWDDFRNITWDIYGQRLDAAGNDIWSSNGVAVSATNNDQLNPSMVPDGEGGAIVAFSDNRTGTDYDIYAQRMTRLGSPMWPAHGVTVCVAPGNQSVPLAVADGEGGMTIVWKDTRNGGSFDAYAQRVDASGLSYWAANGTAIAVAPGAQYATAVVRTSDGAAITAWQDDRGGGIGDIYAQRIDPRHGYWGRPDPAISSAIDNPDDQGGRVALNWAASERDVLTLQEISHYSLWRAVDAIPGTVVAENEQGGARVVALSDVSSDFSGVAYRAGSNLATDYYWEYVANQSAIYAPGYSYLVPTRQDSIAGDPSTHYFQVVSHTFDPMVFFPSAPDSGYSVDNLSPAAPLMLAAARAGGSLVDLDWGASGQSEPDFNEYRVFRSSSAGVSTDPSNFLLATPDTLALDTSATPTMRWYYRVVAFDVHGNKSDDSNEAEVDLVTTGIDDRTPALTSLTLLPNMPNPFGSATELRFGLPEASGVVLDVYDVKGRRVYTRALPRIGAGWKSITFEGRNEAGSLLPSGVYFYRVTAAGATTTRKMVIQR